MTSPSRSETSSFFADKIHEHGHHHGASAESCILRNRHKREAAEELKAYNRERSFYLAANAVTGYLQDPLSDEEGKT
jgi:hypothetical protein